MKIILILCIFSTFVFAQSENDQAQHNEPNKAFVSSINKTLRASNYYVTCTSTRSGRYIASAGAVLPPGRWEFECEGSVSISWDVVEVSGEPAVNYRLVYLTSAYNVNEMETTETMVTLPIADLSLYQILIEGYDESGNSVYVESYRAE